jgi:hypothetical protein
MAGVEWKPLDFLNNNIELELRNQAIGFQIFRTKLHLHSELEGQRITYFLDMISSIIADADSPTASATFAHINSLP